MGKDKKTIKIKNIMHENGIKRYVPV